MTTLINGKNSEQLTATDRGLHYGDGLFETTRVHNGRIALLQYHLARLTEGCKRLDIVPPAQQQLEGEAREAAQQQQEGLIKLIVTRGSGGRGYRPQVGMNATRILMTYPLPQEPDILTRSGGIRAGIAATRLARQPRLAGLKHLNRLEQVLAAGEPGDFEERIMLDTEGYVIDGTMMNLFLVERAVLVTPDLSVAGVAGIMRGKIMELAAAVGTRCKVRAVQPAELERADEVFMCNAVRGIWPVINVESRPLKVGPVTRQLSEALAGIWP